MQARRPTYCALSVCCYQLRALLLVAVVTVTCRFWKRVVKGALPPTDLRSGSSLVQMSRTGPDGRPALSFVDAGSINKMPVRGVVHQ
jgi:hypothetical protein